MLNVKFEILSSDEIKKIIISAFDILANIGMKVTHEPARELLLDNGCKENGEMMLYPESLVQEAIHSAPCRFTIYGRDPDYQVKIEPGRVQIQPMIGRINIWDQDQKKARPTELADVENLVKIADYCDNYHILHSGAIMPEIKGIDPQLAHIEGYIASVRNSRKVIKASCRGGDVARDCIEMASIIAGGRDKLKNNPNVYTTCNVVSPLTQAEGMIEGMIEYAKLGLPVDVTSEPQMGATSPINLSGTLAQQTAEILSVIVIAQLVNKGTPVFFGTCGAAMDMRTSTIALGGIEAGILNVGHAQIAQALGIPSRGTGSNTEAKILDIQAGYEKALSLALPALAGMNMIFYPGTMDHAKTVSLESLVIDNDICGMIFRILQGITVNDRNISLDIIKKVGAGGHFLGQRQTMEDLKIEQYLPSISDRLDRKKWEEKGAKDLVDRASEKVKDILKNHEVLPLPKDIEKELIKFLDAKRKDTKKIKRRISKS